MSQQLCAKHKQPITFICTVQTCKQNRKICDFCKQKETLHFSHHANYIYKLKQFFQFKNSKVVLPRLQKGIHDAQIFIGNHKQFYNSQIQRVNQDFAQMAKSFQEVTQQYKTIYIANFQKEIKTFDQDLMGILANLKTYANQKNQQESFFSKLFTNDKNQFDIQQIVSKNALAFKIRSDIINIRSRLASSKTNKNFYKNSAAEQQKFKDLNLYLKQILATTYDKLKSFINSQGASSSESTSLKSSIASDSKQLTLSRAGSLSSLASKEDLIDLRKSIAIQNRIKVGQMHVPHPKVIDVIKYLKPLPNFAQWNNLKYEGPYKYEAGTYQGSFQNSLRSGKGTFVFNDGSYYEGGWENDQISGYGRFVKQYSYYQGDIKDAKANGKGNYQDIQKSYSGTWKNDKRHGIGEQQFKNTRRKYVGNFVEDRYQGKGKLIDQQYIYEGDFKNGLFDGEAHIKYRNGQIFIGTFKENFRVFGRHSFPDGSFYEGTFRANMPDGRGQFYWADGIKYTGNWREGVQEGEGIQILANGKQMLGLWQKGNWVRWI